MPHQCVRCNTFYKDGAEEILKGCDCGARLFFFIKQEKLEKAKKITNKLKESEKRQIEQDVLDITDSENDDTPVVLDFETIKVLEPGKYELDLVKIFKKDPMIFKLEEGKYVIDLSTALEKYKK